MRKRFVVVHARLPGPLADAREGLTRAVGVGEAAAVERHAEHNLGGGYAIGGVVCDGLLGVEGGAAGIGGRGIPVCVVACDGVPGAGVVVGPWYVRASRWDGMWYGRRKNLHEVPEVEIAVHSSKLHLLVVRGA